MNTASGQEAPRPMRKLLSLTLIIAPSAFVCGTAAAEPVQPQEPERQQAPDFSIKPATTGDEPDAQNASPADTPEAATQEIDIVVTAEKKRVLRDPGATEYVLDGNLQGSVADVLNTIPSVTVSSDGEVTVRGHSDVEVFIDGRPSGSMDRESRGTTLQAMPGDSVESVEVITNPSVAVASEGSSIINLKLKKNASLGPRAALSGSVGNRWRNRASLDSSYGWQDIKLDFDASYREDVRLDGDFTERFYTDAVPGDIARSTILAKYSPTRSRFANLQSELRFTLSEKTDLGGSAQYTQYLASNIVNFTNIDYDDSGNTLAQFARIRDARLVKDSLDLAAFVTRRGFGEVDKLDLRAQHGTSMARSDRTFSLMPAGVVSPISLEYVGDYVDTSFSRATADLEARIDNELSLSAGMEWESADNLYRNGRLDLPLRSSFPADFVGIPTKFGVAKDEVAGHALAKAEWGEWKFESGIGLRATEFSLSNGGKGPFLKRRIGGADFSLASSRVLGPGQVLVSLSRRLQLPDPQDLNPAVIFLDVQNRYVGNPALRAQETVRAELGYDGPLFGINAAATLYYRVTDDAIADIYEAVGEGIIQRSRINAGLTRSYGVETTLSGKLAPEVRFSVSGNLFRAETSFSNFGIAERDALVTYSSKGWVDWAITEQDNLRLDAVADGPTLLVQGHRSGSRALSAVWRHTVSPKLKFSVSAQQLVQNAFVLTNITTPTAETFTRKRNNTTAVLFEVEYALK